MSDHTTPAPIRERMRAALTAAMRERDMATVKVIRSALGAIDNAEAVDSSVSADQIDDRSVIAGAVAGVGNTDVRRRALSEPEIDALIRAEMADRVEAAADYDAAGEAGAERAALLRAEAATLATFVEA